MPLTPININKAITINDIIMTDESYDKDFIVCKFIPKNAAGFKFKIEFKAIDQNPKLKIKRIIRDPQLQNMHDMLLSMKPDKWYPVLNKQQLKMILVLIETGYYKNIEFYQFQSHLKIKSNEETKSEFKQQTCKTKAQTNEKRQSEINLCGQDKNVCIHPKRAKNNNGNVLQAVVLLPV